MFDLLGIADDHGNFKNFYLEDYIALMEQSTDLEKKATKEEKVGGHIKAAAHRSKSMSCKIAAETIISVALKFPVAKA